jgi:hypothetical protein
MKEIVIRIILDPEGIKASLAWSENSGAIDSADGPRSSLGLSRLGPGSSGGEEYQEAGGQSNRPSKLPKNLQKHLLVRSTSAT